MRFTLYLIGYGNQAPEQFLDRLAFAGDQALVLDVRSRRVSWARSYTGDAAEWTIKSAGYDYLWLPGLGGNGQVEPINRLFGMQCLEAKVREDSRPVVLMCAERLSTRCHRARLAEELRARLQSVGDGLEIRPL